MNYSELTNKETVDKTVKALEEKGYSVFVVEKGSEALEKIKTLIPKGASVMNGASKTLEAIDFPEYLKSGQNGWENLHAKVNAEVDPEKRRKLRKEATLSDYYLGSVHSLTEDGQMVIGSNSGSQLPHITFTSPNIIFVIGTQKIVPNLGEAMKRLENYVVPLEDRHMKDLGAPGTVLSKVLIFKSENPHLGRKVNIILVKEKLGF
jgi:L-lactate utilization protein LutB